VRFHTQLDVLRTSEVRDSGPRQQLPSFELECSGLVRIGAQSFPARVQNISLAGAAVSNVEGLKMSTPILLSMPDMPPLEAVVSWTDGDQAELTFSRRLPVEDLAVWIEQHQSLLATGSSCSRSSEVSEGECPAVPPASIEEHPTVNVVSRKLGTDKNSPLLRASGTPLFELLYVSSSTLYIPDDEAIVAEILAAARERNRHLGLTGGLIFTQRHFVQYLEGEETSIAEVMASIRRDPRHRDIKLVHSGRCDARRFADWGMAYSGPSVFVSQQVETLLMNTSEAELETRASHIMSMMEEFSAHSRNNAMKKVA
jgi:hypothetical protein